MEKERTDQGGWMMSNVGAWLREEKLSGITAAGILFSVVVFGLFIFVYVKKRLGPPSFFMDGKTYITAGVIQIEDNGKKLYYPVYREAQ